MLAPGLWMNKSKAKAQAMSEGCELPKNPMVRVSAAQDCQPPAEFPSPALLCQLQGRTTCFGPCRQTGLQESHQCQNKMTHLRNTESFNPCPSAYLMPWCLEQSSAASSSLACPPHRIICFQSGGSRETLLIQSLCPECAAQRLQRYRSRKNPCKPKELLVLSLGYPGWHWSCDRTVPPAHSNGSPH